MNEYRKFGEYVTVSERSPDAIFPNRKPEVMINWSCLGEQPLSVVTKFHADLGRAITYAEAAERYMKGADAS